MQKQEVCTKCECEFNASLRFPITPCTHMVCLECIYKTFKEKKTYYCKLCSIPAIAFSEFEIYYGFEQEKHKAKRRNKEIFPIVEDVTNEKKPTELKPESMAKVQSKLWKFLPEGMIDSMGGKLSVEQQVKMIRKLQYRENEERLKLFKEIEEIVNKHKTIIDEGINELNKVQNVISEHIKLKGELKLVEETISQKVNIIKESQKKLMEDANKKKEAEDVKHIELKGELKPVEKTSSQKVKIIKELQKRIIKDVKKKKEAERGRYGDGYDLPKEILNDEWLEPKKMCKNYVGKRFIRRRPLE